MKHGRIVALLYTRRVGLFLSADDYYYNSPQYSVTNQCVIENSKKKKSSLGAYQLLVQDTVRTWQVQYM